MSRLQVIRRANVLAWVCIAGGTVYRLVLSLRASVGYDEVFVMSVGLDEMLTSARGLLIEGPLRHSNAITPLWWWVQALPVYVTGEITLAGLRVIPVLLGTVTLAAAFLVARSRLGRGPAVLFVVFAASSDVLALCNARGEFAEALLLLGVMPYACLIGDPSRTRTKALLGCLMLMTHLGKGLFLLAAMTLADVLAQMLRSSRRGAVFHSRLLQCVRGPSISLAVAILATLGWLICVEAFKGAGPVNTDIGPVSGPAEMLWELTAVYARTKAHMVAEVFDAAQVWLDGWVWPISAFSAVPLLVGAVAALRRVRGRRGALALGLTAWVALGLLAVIGRGMVGARFHLVYLPALWLAASVGLWRLRRLSPRCFWMVGGFWIAWVLPAFSWVSWQDRLWRPSTLALVLMAAVALAWVLRATRQTGGPHRRVRTGSATAYAGAILVVGLIVACGPMRWAPFARMEPSAGMGALITVDAFRRGETPLPTSSGRTLYLDLANYYLRKDPRTAGDLGRAEHFARLETRRVPNSALAWFYLGEVLHQAGGPVDEVRAAWERSYDLNPVPSLRQRLDALPAAPGPSPVRSGDARSGWCGLIPAAGHDPSAVIPPIAGGDEDCSADGCPTLSEGGGRTRPGRRHRVAFRRPSLEGMGHPRGAGQSPAPNKDRAPKHIVIPPYHHPPRLKPCCNPTRPAPLGGRENAIPLDPSR